MRILFIAFLLFAATNAFADITLQCERYTVKEGGAFKQDRIIFTLTFSSDNQSVIYKKISGPEWFMPSESVLQPIWKSRDGLRVVASWLNSDYEKIDTVWHPVHILDIDFKKPRYEMDTYGGFADFNEMISSPWKQECIRTD